MLRYYAGLHVGIFLPALLAFWPAVSEERFVSDPSPFPIIDIHVKPIQTHFGLYRPSELISGI